MPTGPNASPEHVFIDENLNAKGHDFYNIGAYSISPNHKLVAYTEDTKGNEIYTLFVIDAESRKPVGKSLVGVKPDIVWASDEALLYTTVDTNETEKAWLHKLGQEQSNDVCLYHNKDAKFSVGVDLSENKKFVFISSGSRTTSFVYYLDTEKLEKGIIPVTPRVDGVITSVGYRGNHFFITRKTKELYNSELLVCPVNNVSATTVVLPHRESVTIEEMKLFSDHLVLMERENGLAKVSIYNLPSVGEQVQRLERPRAVKFMDPVYTVELFGSLFNSTILRYSYSSLRTPSTVFDYDMNTGISVRKWNETVLGGFDSSNYIAERKWATAQDGIRVPMSIVYKKDLVKLDGSGPMFLQGYGSYGNVNDPDFSASRLSLLNRGFIYVIAHVRGGGEMGTKWYENGKFLKKKNTFTDFIACAEYLIKNKYTRKEKLSIYGGSAGGMLIGAVLNMRPDLFKAAIAGVPFVDVLTTMLDPTVPLTTAEYEEWGNPDKEEFYRYIKSYSPVDNISAQKYPSLLVTAGLNDGRVLYSEPAKFVAKLRDMKTDKNPLLFKIDFGAGHFSKSGRFEKLEKDALFFTFILKELNMAHRG